MGRRRKNGESQKIKRFCLKCDRPFIAEGRFNRLCSRCKKANQSYDGALAGHERYSVSAQATYRAKKNAIKTLIDQAVQEAGGGTVDQVRNYGER
jgi:hypothetical protein